MTIIPDRLAALDELNLKSGSHSPGSGQFCFNEAAAWLAGERHTDAPDCVSRVLRNYTMRLNDRWSDEQRQTLKPYLPRMVGTGGDGKDEIRRRIAAEALCTDLLPPWLRLAGLDEHADRISGMAGASYADLGDALWKARDAGWAARAAKLDEIRAKVRERLAAKPVAVAVAAAVAVAVAAAAADPYAKWNAAYNAAYNAARAYYREHPLPIVAEAANLAEVQRGKALELLDRLIEAQA